MPTTDATFKVQTHPQGSISFDQIQWKNRELKGWRYETTAMFAHISFDRVDDFIEGQRCLDGLPME